MIRWFRDFYRLLYINYVLARYGVGRAVLSVRPKQPWWFLSYFNPFYWLSNRKRSRGESVRVALQTLGPIFVKFGQTLSTRRDFIPDDIADELERLVDNVPGFSGEAARKRVERSLGRSTEALFAHFEIEPMASASIAQVHRAVLLDGSEVAVKVLRPHIKRAIQRDIRLMYLVAAVVQRFYSEGYRLKPVELVREFETTIIDELDLMREGANASQLRRNFADSSLLYVPKVYWEYTRDDILVTEMIYGTPITDVATLRAAKMDMKRLAEHGVEIFFTQVFRDSFFHADMHRGNIFVSTKDPSKPKYMAVDFGIMGVLSPSDQRYLAENLLAFFKRDYRQVAVLHVESGWVPATTRVEEFESAIRAVCEPIFERPLNEISFGQLLMRLFQTASRFKMEIQPQLMLLQKTLLSVEGIGRQLYPELDLWATAKPFLEKWLKERISARALLNSTLDKAPFWAEKLVDVPDMLYKLLEMRAELMPQRVIAEQMQPTSVARKHFPSVAVGLALLFGAGLTWWFQAESMQTRTVLEASLAGLGGLLVILGWVYR